MSGNTKDSFDPYRAEVIKALEEEKLLDNWTVAQAMGWIGEKVKAAQRYAKNLKGDHGTKKALQARVTIERRTHPGERFTTTLARKLHIKRTDPRSIL